MIIRNPFSKMLFSIFWEFDFVKIDFISNSLPLIITDSVISINISQISISKNSFGINVADFEMSSPWWNKGIDKHWCTSLEFSSNIVNSFSVVDWFFINMSPVPMIQNFNLITFNFVNSSSDLINVFIISEFNNPNIVFKFNLFNFMCIPPSFLFINIEFNNIFPSSLFVEFLNINKHGEPSLSSLTFSVSSEEIFSFNIEASFSINVNKNVELVLSVWCEEVVFRLIN